MAKDMLYKPNLTYDKNYYTDGSLYDNSNDYNDEYGNANDESSDKIDRLDELKNEIINKLPMMPENIVEPFLPPFFIIGGIIDDLINNKDNIPKPPKDEETTIVTPIAPEDTGDLDDELDDVPDNPFDIEKEDGFVNIKIEDIPKDIELEIEYIRDITDIYKDYLTKYNSVFDKYINSTVSCYNISKNKDIKNIETKDLVKNNNLSHISDFITKSNIVVEQKVRLATKLFDLDETIFHIRSTKVANELRKRYYTNEKMEDKDSLSKAANDLLKESKLISQKKYEENFYALYKYLNSSVILFNECIGTVAKQKKALVTLNNEERD